MKGPQVMRGYVDSSLDADAFTADGFLHTGDLGRFDAHGAILITGRIKDIIIRKGENVSAKEVEDVLYAHPKIADVAVLGIPDARPRRDGASRSSCPPTRPTPPTLHERVRALPGAGLMTQKIPERLEIIDVMPRNPSGKVPKHELRATHHLTVEPASAVGWVSGTRATRASKRRCCAGSVGGGVLGVPLHREEPAAGPVELERLRRCRRRRGRRRAGRRRAASTAWW